MDTVFIEGSAHWHVLADILLQIYRERFCRLSARSLRYDLLSQSHRFQDPSIGKRSDILGHQEIFQVQAKSISTASSHGKSVRHISLQHLASLHSKHRSIGISQTHPKKILQANPNPIIQETKKVSSPGKSKDIFSPPSPTHQPPPKPPPQPSCPPPPPPPHCPTHSPCPHPQTAHSNYPSS